MQNRFCTRCGTMSSTRNYLEAWVLWRIVRGEHDHKVMSADLGRALLSPYVSASYTEALAYPLIQLLVWATLLLSILKCISASETFSHPIFRLSWGHRKPHLFSVNLKSLSYIIYYGHIRLASLSAEISKISRAIFEIWPHVRVCRFALSNI